MIMMFVRKVKKESKLLTGFPTLNMRLPSLCMQALSLGYSTVWTDKGHAATFTDPSKLQLAGNAQASPAVEIGIAAGLHNSLRVSYFSTKRSGTTTAANEMVIFSQPYAAGDQLSTNGKISDYKLSYEYLTWPYPVEARHFRLKTLYQVQYIEVKTVF